jgi:hypothetical protein
MNTMPERTLRSHARTSRISKRRLALDDIQVRGLREGAMKLARRSSTWPRAVSRSIIDRQVVA